MLLRNIESLKIMKVIFDLRSFSYIKSQLAEHLVYAIHCQCYRMQTTVTAASTWQ